MKPNRKAKINNSACVYRIGCYVIFHTHDDADYLCSRKNNGRIYMLNIQLVVTNDEVFKAENSRLFKTMWYKKKQEHVVCAYKIQQH